MTGDRDLLERATSALRETPPPTHDELARGRAELLATHRQLTKRSRVRTLRWVLPLAAMLAAGSALAATPHGFERALRAAVEIFAPSQRVATKTPRKKAAPEPVRDVAPAVAALPAAPAVEAPVVEAPALHVEQAPSAASPKRVSRPDRTKVYEPKAEPAKAETPAVAQPVARDEPDAAPPAEAPIDRDLATYREAHRVHFRARDFASALRWWDTYLSMYPHGTFAVEARYNRAMCLVRLGKKGEARAALAPFASGEVAQGYRQAEAKKLLEALE